MLVSEFHKYSGKHTLSLVRLIIRADASPSVGTGHVMRSSTIAEEFLSLGHEVLYVGNIDPMSLILERFDEIGLRYQVSLPEDIDPCNETDILLIDSYTLQIDDPFIAKKRWLKTCSISDSVTPNFDVDLVIRPSLTTQPKLSGQTQVLSGVDYILLRKSIKKNCPRNIYDPTPLRILVVGGGSDPSGFCNELARIIAKIPNNFTVDIFSDNSDGILGIDSRIRIHKVGLSMNEFADNCDLALTVASSLSLEFIAREIPIGVACAFENQRSGFSDLVSLNFAVPIGEHDISGNWNFNEKNLREIISSGSLRNNLRSRALGLIDMKGPERVALEIIKS